MKNTDMPKCKHFRCSSEIVWDRTGYDLTSLSDGITRYKGKCPNCGTNYLHDAEALDLLIGGLGK